MAFFSNTIVGWFPTQTTQMRGRLDGAVTRSGNVVTLNNLVLTLSSQSSVSGSKNFTFTLNGTANVCNINVPTPRMALGTFNLTTVGFTATDTEWQRTINWSTSDGASGSFTVAFPVAPTKPTVTSAGKGFRTISVTYGTTSFGVPDNGSVKLYGGTTANPTTQIDSYDQTGDKTFTLTDVLPSTTYHFRATASNGQKSASSSDITITSQADPKFLGSARGKAVRIKKMYCSVDGKTKNMKFYGSVSGVTKRIF